MRATGGGILWRWRLSCWSAGILPALQQDPKLGVAQTDLVSDYSNAREGSPLASGRVLAPERAGCPRSV